MKSIKPSILGCGGVFVIIGLILVIFYRDRIGADILTFGLWLVATIILFWLLTYLYKLIRK